MSSTNSQVPEDLKARMKESYDAIATEYNSRFVRDDDAIRLDYLERLFQRLRENGKQDATVLELGCGAGIPGTRTLLENKSPSFSVTANDLSTTQIDLAKKNLEAYSERLTLVQGDMLQLSFEDGSLDAVVGFYSIIHLPREEQTVLLHKIAKWLKPDGFLLANFSKEELPVAIDENWLKQEKGWVFWSGWGSEKTLKIVEDAGFEVLIKEVKQDVKDAAFLWILAKVK
ncbi:methyltransferase domain-containing protein [Aaosphaeria arxii CBS 175.79]|uniref:Methyltransferase domain-containing protein n=1 Tax=Aaosphaeria arxii CBS 175.79 TaxID=1450172 RepID=A0A6A5Y6T5_9PLEO|nr:methyltransferase domain-containing protein [Aaosphaeria arxii CBS 175.79]KAF2021009.1 methyltransferase domain-containing protein [Aaosphaeria arxii CBS 175.79]